MRTFWARVGCIVKGFAGWVMLCVGRRGGGGLGDEVEMLAIDAALLLWSAKHGLGDWPIGGRVLEGLVILERRDNILLSLWFDEGAWSYLATIH